MEWYHVVMLSGGQLRHYEVYESSHAEAYISACEIDRDEYRSNSSHKQGATVINHGGVAHNF